MDKPLRRRRPRLHESGALGASGRLGHGVGDGCRASSIFSLHRAHERVLGQSLAAQLGGDPRRPSRTTTRVHMASTSPASEDDNTTVSPFRDSSAIRS